MKKKQKRLWIQDFRIPSTPENRYVASLMEIWKQHRERPKHFVRAIRMYQALVDGDIDMFFDILIEFAPKTARLLMQGQVSVASTVRPERTPRSKQENRPSPIISESAPQGGVDDFLQSLGLTDMEF